MAVELFNGAPPSEEQKWLGLRRKHRKGIPLGSSDSVAGCTARNEAEMGSAGQKTSRSRLIPSSARPGDGHHTRS